MSKTVLVTGANRGIGLAFAKAYKAKGYRVIGTARNVQDVDELKQVTLEIHALDVGQEQSIQQLAAALKSVPIDLLINNAGVYNRQPFESMTMDLMLDEYRVNALGPIFVTRALLPNLESVPQPRVINITSRMGSVADNTSGGSYGYRASKSALNAMTKSLSIDLKHIPVLVVHPGFIQTRMVGGRGDMPPEESVDLIIKNIIDPFELPEDQSQWKSGQFVHRDGTELPW